MEKKKISTIIFFFLLSLLGVAQEKVNIIRPGLIKVMGTISPSKMLGSSGAYFYLHGNLEIYFNKQVSFCGDVYGFSGGIHKNTEFDYNHNLLYGFALHQAHERNDLYIAIQPGCSLTKLKTDTMLLKTTQVGVNPVMSLAIGDNFYVSRFFHFFIQARLIVGEHSYDIHKNISEMRLSAGLGFNINTLKAK